MRAYLFFGIKIALAGWIIWFLAHSNLLEPAALKHLLTLETHLFLALLGLVLTVVVATYRWWLLLRVQGIPVRFLTCMYPSYVGFGLNQFLPGGVGGDVVRLAFVLRVAPAAKARGVTTLLADRALGLAALMVLMLMCFLTHRAALSHHTHVLWMVDMSAVCIGMGLLAAAVAVVLPDDVGVSRWLSARVSHAPLLAALVSTVSALHSFRRTPRQIIYAFFVSLVVQTIVAFTLFHISQLMGFEIAFWHIVLASSMSQIASMLPLTPGGIGVGEAAFAGTLIVLGYPASLGLGSVLIGLRVLSVGIALPAYAMYFNTKQL